MTARPSVDQALQTARARGLDRLDAQLLLAHRIGRPRSWLLAHGDAPLAADQQAAFDADCRSRLDGMPVAYLLGQREFHGLALRVTRDVLVPRPETEGLVDWALELLRTAALCDRPEPQVIDLGTGSGAIALAIAHRCPRARVTATDRSAAALAVARGNAAQHGLELTWRLGDWWQAVGDATFDLALANPPYVAAGDPHLNALRHEPPEALISGPSGLDDLARIIAGADAHLAGWLIVEHGHDQVEAVAAAMSAAGAAEVQTRADLGNHPRHTAGYWAPRRT